MTKIPKIACFIALLVCPILAKTQENTLKWDLKTCIAYARKQNIQIRKNKIAWQENIENKQQAKAQIWPSLAFGTNQNYSNQPALSSQNRNSHTGSYNLNSNFALYQGGKMRKNIQQLDLQTKVQQLTVEEAEDNIEIAVTQAFVQILYANENVRINENTVEVAKAQLDRGKGLVEAGALAQPDFAQLEAQYTSDKYQLVVAQTTLANNVLELKQLLELGIQDRLELKIPPLSDDSVLLILPPKEIIYSIALAIRPEVKYNRLNIQVAGIEKQKARAGYLPELNLSLALGSSHLSGTGYSFGEQIKDNWSENVGLTLSVPIFSNRANKTAVNLAKLNYENAELEYENVQKNLLKTIENIWQEAISAQERFRSAKENLNAVKQSFTLIEQQFFLGMKNTIEMLTEKNNLLSARQEVLQAKYMAILNRQLLNFYEGKEIEI